MADGAGEALQRRFFDVALPQRARLTLDDPMHQSRARWPVGLPEPGPAVRLVSGPVPFGYLDGLSAPVLHVAVLSDPRVAFLRFARRMMRADAQEVLRAAGARPGAEALRDLDRATDWLLDQPLVRRSRLGATVRLLAGAPMLSTGEDPADLLPAAQANLWRVNLLTGVEGRLDAFASDLSAALGWTPPFRDVDLIEVEGPSAEELSPGPRARLEAATAADRALLSTAWDVASEEA